MATVATHKTTFSRHHIAILSRRIVTKGHTIVIRLVLVFGVIYWPDCTPICSVAWCELLAGLHTDLFSRHASPLEVDVLCRSTKGVKMLCPTRFVVDATENSKKGRVAAEVHSSQTGLWTKSKRNILLLLPRSPK